MTQKPPDPGLEECLSAGVGGQCSLKGLEAKQRAEHVVESHQWTSRDPGNDLDSTLVIEFLLCAWDKSTFQVFSKFPSPSWMGTSADSTLPHYCDHQLLQENVEKWSMWVRTQSCPTLVTPWTVAHQALLSMGFFRQEYLSGLSFPPPGGLPDPGNEPTSPASPASAGRFFTTEPPGKAREMHTHCVSLPSEGRASFAIWKFSQMRLNTVIVCGAALESGLEGKRAEQGGARAGAEQRFWLSRYKIRQGWESRSAVALRTLISSDSRSGVVDLN